MTSDVNEDATQQMNYLAKTKTKQNTHMTFEGFELTATTIIDS